MRWRDQRPWRSGRETTEFSGSPDESEGPGLVFGLAPETWEAASIDLGDLAETQINGYRYLLTTTTGDVHHFMAQDPIPDGAWDPPYAEPAF